jgi:hypothetical protein
VITPVKKSSIPLRVFIKYLDQIYLYLNVYSILKFIFKLSDSWSLKERILTSKLIIIIDLYM